MPFASTHIRSHGATCMVARYSPSPDHHSPVNPPFWPNPGCTPSVEALLSPWGQGIALQEASMAARQTSSQNVKSIIGAILLALGFLVLFGNLDAVSGQISRAAGTPVGPTQGMLPALVLAALHALQDFAF